MPDWIKNMRGWNLHEIEDLERIISENSTEQKTLSENFKISMNKFAGDRSVETCLDALNVSIQLASIRRKLMEAYEQYARLLEGEIIRLRRLCEDKVLSTSSNNILHSISQSISNTILFLIIPRFSIEISTMSPSLRYFGSFIDIATPAGVPVDIISPASRVIILLREEIMFLIEMTILLLEEFCLISPLTLVIILKF